MNIDYNKIITINDVLKITDEELENIKKNANTELGLIKAKLNESNRTPKMIAQKASERIYLGSDYKYENNTNKGILVANIAFSYIKDKDESSSKEKLFIEALQNAGYDFKKLKNFLNRIQYIKAKKDNKNFNLNDEKIEKENLLYIKKITKIMNGYFLEIAPETILNKITILLADFQRITNKITNEKEIKLFYFNAEIKNNEQIINCYFGCNLNNSISNNNLTDVVNNISQAIIELQAFAKRINTRINYTIMETEQLKRIITNEEETETMIKSETKIPVRKLLENTIPETDKKIINDAINGCLIYSANPKYQNQINDIKVKAKTKLTLKSK